MITLKRVAALLIYFIIAVGIGFLAVLKKYGFSWTYLLYTVITVLICFLITAFLIFCLKVAHKLWQDDF